MPRWFVTGAGGQLATAFTRILEGEVFLSREDALDIRDAEAVHAAVHGFAPDVVLHTAAYTDVDGAEADPAAAAAINVEGTRNVVQAVRGTHTVLVYFSTDYVFDGTKDRPYVETDTPRPLSAYGRTKLAGEQEVLGWAHGMVVRTSWLFSENGTNFVKTILSAARSKANTGEPLRVVDDQVGSPTYAGHLAAAVDEALRRMQAGERELAVHPGCGTNIVASGLLAGVCSRSAAVPCRTATSVAAPPAAARPLGCATCGRCSFGAPGPVAPGP